MRVRSLLFDNRSFLQTIYKNTFWLGMGMVVNNVLKLLLLIYVARILGATDYGKFTFALAFVSLFIVFSDLGLPNIVIREMAKESAKEKEIYPLFSLKILLSTGALVLIFIGAHFITSDPLIRRIIYALALFSVMNSFITLFYAFFQARQRMEYQAFLEVFQVILIVALGFLVLFQFPSVEFLSYGYAVAAFIALLAVLLFFHVRILPLHITWEPKIWRQYLSMSWPLALSGLFGTIYTYIDSVMMGSWKLIVETGWYNAAYKIITISLLPMGLISGSFFPALSKSLQNSKEKLQKNWGYQMNSMIFLAIPLVVGGIVLAPRIIPFIYGSDFLPSILVFQILIVMAGVLFLSRPFWDVLIIAHQQRKIFWITLGGAIANVLLNIILIPRFSLYGAAASTLITSLFLFFVFFVFTWRFTSIIPLQKIFFSTFLKAASASVVMYSVISHPAIYYLNVIFAISIGAVVYLGIMYLVRFFYG